jgi:NAD(P)-dependent dehydrogenase (short-subunit alcohol dehydrogenase family)
MTIKTTEFSATSTTSDVLTGIDLKGQRVVVTGATSGIGLEAARSLAQAGAAVTITARSQAKADEALAGLRAAVSGAEFDSVLLELSDLNQVRGAAAELLSTHDRIDILINNAGIMACPLERTAQGCELQFGTNHIGHFLWTCLLVSALKKAPAARVVNLSSAGHKYSEVNFDDPHFEQRPYDKWVSYGQAKTANMLFSVGLAKRGIVSNAVHPGAIVTNLGRHMTKDDYAQFSSQASESRFVYKSVEQGAATSVWAATSPALVGKGGLYLEDCQVGRPAVDEAPTFGYMDYGLDEVAAEQLWQLSENIVGESFTLA